MEEFDAHGSSGQLESLILFLYSSQAHQWGQYFANKAEGVLNQPLIGEFKNGRGELFNQELFNGRTVHVRFVWSDITPDSHHVEQSFSDDGGKTWEPNFVATLTRDQEASAHNFELEADGPAGHIEGVGVRLFKPQSHQLSMNWANGSDAVVTTPMVGRFLRGQGQFYDQEEFQGRIIMSRNGFSAITPSSSRFEQAFSD